MLSFINDTGKAKIIINIYFSTLLLIKREVEMFKEFFD